MRNKTQEYYTGVTFCTYDEDCLLRSTCFNVLTGKVMKDAEKNKDDLLIYEEKPNCYMKMWYGKKEEEEGNEKNW